MSDSTPVPRLGAAALSAWTAQQVRPASTLVERTLPVSGAFDSLLPNGLPRGATLTVSGQAGRSFAFAVAAAATRAGSWFALIGVPDAGWRAVGEAGVALSRVVHVAVRPGSDRVADCVAAALDGFDLVLVGPGIHLTDGVQRRLAARARERGTVLIGIGETPAGMRGSRPAGPLDTVADLRATTRAGRWHGLGSGVGHLTGRQVEVVVEGRRLPGRRRRSRLWLPGPDGTATAVPDPTTDRSTTPGDRSSEDPSGGVRLRPVGRSA